MVEIFLPSSMSADFMALIPAQRKLVNKLLEEGSILSYSLTLDRSRLWIVMVGEEIEDIETQLDTFPIMPYCEAEISELMFHNMISWELPRLSLN